MKNLKNQTLYIAVLAASLTIISSPAQAEVKAKILKPAMVKAAPVIDAHPLLMRRAEVRAAASLKTKSWAPMHKVAAMSVKVSPPSSNHWFSALRTQASVGTAPALRARAALKRAANSSSATASPAHLRAAAIHMTCSAPPTKIVRLDYYESARFADYLDMWEAYEALGGDGFDPEQIDPLIEIGDGS